MKRLLVSLMVSLGLLFAFPGVGSAAGWNPFDDACSSGGGRSAVCSNDSNGGKDPLSGNNGLIMKVTNIIAVIAGIAAIIIIILAGLRMVTSGGSTEDIAGARRTLIYAVVGLVVLVLARTIIGLVLSKL